MSSRGHGPGVGWGLRRGRVRRAGLAAVCLLAPLAAGGCRDAVAPDDRPGNHTMVFGTLTAGSDTARVLVQRLRAVGGVERVGDARLELSGPGSVPLAEQNPDVTSCLRSDLFGGGDERGDRGCYAGLLPGRVSPGERWELEGTLPDGEAIVGSLVVPGAPAHTVAADRVEVSFRTTPDGLPVAIVPVTVRSAPGAERVEVRTAVVGAWDGAVELRPHVFRCTTRSYAPPFEGGDLLATHDLWIHGGQCRDFLHGGFAPWDSLEVDVIVAAYEENLAGYMREVVDGSAVAASRAGYGVRGAVGVFGAAAVSRSRIKVICDDQCRAEVTPPGG